MCHDLDACFTVQRYQLARYFSAALGQTHKNNPHPGSTGRTLVRHRNDTNLKRTCQISNDTQQTKTRRYRHRSNILKETNTLTLLETPYHQPILRPYHVATFVRFPGVHAFRQDNIDPVWLLCHTRRPHSSQTTVLLRHCLVPET